MPALCVITGGTSGIGRAAALALARCDVHLVLLGRNRAAGERLAAKVGRHQSTATAEFVPVDLASMSETRALAEGLLARFPKVDVLINNAGARFDTFEATPDGFERTFATNHLGHFLLTALLLDRLMASPVGRVITVTSSAADRARPGEPWLTTAATFDRKRAYAESKLANLLFAFELGRRLSGTPIRSIAMDPGVVLTGFARNNGFKAWVRHLLYHAAKRQLILARTPGRALAHLALTRELPAEVECFFRLEKPARACAAAYDRTAARELWRASVEAAKLDHQTGPAWKWSEAS